jgi:hypothetical protein
MPVGVPSARIACATLATALVLLAPGAHAEDAPGQEPSHEHRRFGIGWQVGNGLGFRGADVVVAPWRRLAFELQVSQVKTDVESGPSMDETASGWGVAPVVRAYLWRDGLIVPYAAAGGSVTRLTWRSLSWTTTGLFATVGAEWRTGNDSWASCLRMLLGAGVGYSPAVAESNGSERIWSDRRRGANLELGLRCMFF